MAFHHFHEFDPYELILELLIPTIKLKVHHLDYVTKVFHKKGILPHQLK
jgi:hypothetical protein